MQCQSSSIEYQHEPFVTFQRRVLSFANNTIWPDANASDIVVERLKGGSFNRIIGLTRKSHEEPYNAINYILRIPRFDAAQVYRDVAILRFVQRHTEIPIPGVVMFDESKNNGLEELYMVQHRVAGESLYPTFPKLDHQARCKVARELGTIYHQMLAIRSSTAGHFVLPAGDKSIDAPLQVAPFQSHDATLAVPYNDLVTAQSVFHLLTTSFQDQKARRSFLAEEMDQFCTMASELDAEEWFTDMVYSLAHRDLAPRNILVNPGFVAKQPIISAVLDWDSGVLAPMFLSCTPPLWIWAWLDDEDEDERTANDDPPTPEWCQLKQIFEEAADEDYIRLAYPPAYRLARRLVRFAIDDIASTQGLKEADAMLQEWATIRRSTEQVS